MKVPLEITDEMLEQAAREVTGSDAPEDIEIAIESFKEMLAVLERLSLGAGPEEGINPHAHE